jgi:hypothetical protein
MGASGRSAEPPPTASRASAEPEELAAWSVAAQRRVAAYHPATTLALSWPAASPSRAAAETSPVSPAALLWAA